MKRITPPPCRAAKMRNQELHRAREIIRNRGDHSAGAIIIATRSIARLSPHKYERSAATDALNSIRMRAA